MYTHKDIKDFKSYIKKNHVCDNLKFKKKNPQIYLNLLENRNLSEAQIEDILKYQFKHFYKEWNRGDFFNDLYKKVFRCRRGKRYKSCIDNIRKFSLLDKYCATMNLIIAKKMIKLGINRDLVLKELESTFKKRKATKNIPTEKEIKILYNIYADRRMIKLLMGSDSEDIKFYLEEIYKLKKDVEINFNQEEIRRYRIYSRKPRSLKYIHDRMVDKLKEKQQFRGVDDFKLKPREDLLKLDGKEISYKDNIWKVYVAKTKLDLVKFSQSSQFSNCIGTNSVYGESARKGESTILGIFSKEGKPLYCIQTAKYCFKAALGVGNSTIPKNIYQALQNLLTVEPELPEDFNKIKHSFVYGYKYNPESQVLYIMFKNSGIYEYQNVEQEIYEEFSKTEYKGKYLNQVLKDTTKYPYERLS